MLNAFRNKIENKNMCFSKARFSQWGANGTISLTKNDQDHLTESA